MLSHFNDLLLSVPTSALSACPIAAPTLLVAAATSPAGARTPSSRATTSTPSRRSMSPSSQTGTARTSSKTPSSVETFLSTRDSSAPAGRRARTPARATAAVPSSAKSAVCGNWPASCPGASAADNTTYLESTSKFPSTKTGFSSNFCAEFKS